MKLHNSETFVERYSHPRDSMFIKNWKLRGLADAIDENLLQSVIVSVFFMEKMVVSRETRWQLEV